MFGASQSSIHSLYNALQCLKIVFADLIKAFNRFALNDILADGVSSQIPLLAFIAWERFG